MKIWLINHYAVPPQYYPLARPSLFAKNLIKMGHEVTIIAASSVHNSTDINLIEDGEKVKTIIDDGIPYVLINCTTYHNNGIKRIKNIIEFAGKLSRVLDTLDKPDAIVSTSFDPLSCYAGIKYAKKNGVKAIAEIADLWPETLVAYGKAKKGNPIVKALRRLEKKIYEKSDAIVFTMEGAYDYIIEQCWQNDIPKTKVFYINNGVDLKQFDKNKETYKIDDKDLENSNTFKIVYTGSIRMVNNLKKLVDVAEKVSHLNVTFLIWGNGDQVEPLKEYVMKKKINNVHFKGKVEKKYIPYITSKADLNIVHNEESPIMRFGLSMNKIFDYLAAGKPILIDFNSPYNPVIDNKAGIQPPSSKVEDIADTIEKFIELNISKKNELSASARKAAQMYDFEVLTRKLEKIIISI